MATNRLASGFAHEGNSLEVAVVSDPGTDRIWSYGRHRRSGYAHKAAHKDPIPKQQEHQPVGKAAAPPCVDFQPFTGGNALGDNGPPTGGPMFERINPDQLNGRQKEIYNFQKSAALLADYGFNCIKLSDDWRGADFLAHHFDGKTTLRVQLKARLTIDRKYAGQDLWMNFPCGRTWYLVPHDVLVEQVGRTTNWLNTSSWQDHGLYSSTNPSPALLEQLLPFALARQEEPKSSPTTISSEPPVQPAPQRSTRSVGVAPGRSNVGRWRHPNLAAAANALTEAGYTCSGPPREFRGNYLAAKGRDGANVTVRCPGRLDIRKEQVGKNLYIAFPDQDGTWYLVPHDELVRLAKFNTPWLETKSWRADGWYSSANPSRQMRGALSPFALRAT